MPKADYHPSIKPQDPGARFVVETLRPSIDLVMALVQSLFTCNHGRTPVNEGKCYCPDCGRGVIYQWVVLRCEQCHVRRESRYFLRRVVPVERCCTQCGESAYRTDYLEAPSYFQLHKARLVAQAEDEYLRRRFAWVRPAWAWVDSPLAGRLLQSVSSLLDPTEPALGYQLVPVR